MQDPARLLSWWLTFSLILGVPLWIGWGSEASILLGLHVAPGILALLASFAHANKAEHGPAWWSGQATTALTGGALVSGWFAIGTAGLIFHVVAGMLLATALFVHVAGRSFAHIFGGWKTLGWAVAGALPLGLIVSLF